MTASSSSSSSSSSLVPNSSRKKYDVFLSFRGEDTRNGFTSHLHKALLKKNIETYIDERLERGDVISEALMNAIEESNLSLIIFSENYASSSWCLEELVHILQCKERNSQIVIPVFYHVDPSNVRKQQGSYAVAFATLEERFKINTEKLNQWRAALTTAANLSGCNGPTTRNESELIETVVGDIEKKLKSTPETNDGKGLVGMDNFIERIESLPLTSLKKVRIIGIWGMGGLGKTTLAHVIFRRIYSQFEGTCFLENIREEWKKHGSVYLKNIFFSQLMEEKNQHIGDAMILKKKVNHKKLLIVLDDIDDREYFEYLVGDCNWLKPDSRIIITTRNKQVLRTIGVDNIYNLEYLNENEARQLFCLNAFKESSSPESFKELSREVLNYAKGVPLALKVLGSDLYSRSEEEWESALKVTDLHPKIRSVLEISFNGLEKIAKAIFLDIACFFKGMRRDYVEDILDHCGCSTYAIAILIDNSLITITDGNTLGMHDLVQKMGWEIARGQSIGESESPKPSRLWITDDICHILETNTGIETIEGIFLAVDEIRKDINLKPTVFKTMHHLRLLKFSAHGGLCRLHLPQGLHFLPNKLVYLEWDNYPCNSLPFTPYKYLVKLYMRSSQLKQLWNGVQDLGKLKYFNLEYSKNLTCIPDLSQANLKILDLKGCTSLVDVPPLNFQQVEPRKKTLVYPTDFFSLFNEDSIWKPNNTVANYLLDLQDCYNLKSLQKMSGNIEHIRLGSTTIEEPHSSISSLQNLVSIDLRNCKRLKSLPSNICALKSLEYLDLRGCILFDNLPAELPQSLIELNLSGTAIKQVHPSSFECLPSLKFLNMNNCTRLETLPTSIYKLKSLEKLSLSYCSKLESFPKISEPMKSLKVLSLKGRRIKELPWSLGAKSELPHLFLTSWEIINGIRTQRLSYDYHKETTIVLFDEIEVDLTCSSVLKIHDWYLRLSSSALDVVDRSTGTIRDIAMVFKVSEFGGHPEFWICKCKNIGRRKGSFYIIKSTGIYPNPNGTSTRHPELFCPCFTQISCCECSNFNQVRKSMMSELQDKILHLATASTEEEQTREVSDKSRSYMFCCQGNEIPEWFNYRSTGYSIDIKFSSHWRKTNLLGFALCIVFKYKPRRTFNGRMRFHCVRHYKIRCGNGRKYDWTQENQVLMDMGTILDASDHVFVQYFRDNHTFDDATEASFQFYLDEVDQDTSTSLTKFQVQKCGVRLLYRQEADVVVRDTSATLSICNVEECIVRMLYGQEGEEIIRRQHELTGYVNLLDVFTEKIVRRRSPSLFFSFAKSFANWFEADQGWRAPRLECRLF